MDYQLAKELKAAGFPQTHSHSGTYLCGTGTPYHASRPERTEDCYAPTLSELIEACPLQSFELSYSIIMGVWYAVVHHPEMETVTEEGPSPTEAVARLWLALNKK